jgi:hypothetical protein
MDKDQTTGDAVAEIRRRYAAGYPTGFAGQARRAKTRFQRAKEDVGELLRLIDVAVASRAQPDWWAL